MVIPRLWIHVALLLSLGVLALAADAASARSTVAVASSGDHSELVKRLPITSPSSPKPRLLMSIPVRKTGVVSTADHLEVSSELQVTTDCDQRGPRCIGSPYAFNPRVTTYAVLASKPEGKTGRSLLPPRTTSCRQGLPYREHHCVLVRESGQIPVLKRDDCRPKSCYVKLIGYATSVHAGRGEYLAVGGLRPNGTVPQDRGRLNLVHFAPTIPKGSRQSEAHARKTPHLRLNQDRAAIYSQRFRHLKPGSQMSVSAKARIDISSVPYNVVLSSQLIVTDKSGDVVRGVAAHSVSQRGELDEGNGFNCTKNKNQCTIHKVGVLRVEKPLRTRGGDLYITLVTRAGPKRTEAAPSDRVRVAGGGITTQLFPAKSASGASGG